jgi:general secretion pathway protein A
MYLEYWGFSAFPFESVPDPDFFYLSKCHEEALTRLIYAAEMRKGGAMLSGEVGCGKTTLSKVFIKELSEAKYDVGVIINPKLDSKEFLQEIVYQFGISDVPDTKVKCLRTLNDKMIENLRMKKETLLIVDEAQLLNESAFEEVRLLMNFQLNSRFLMTVILIGQPELRDKIKGIEQLNQRIAIKYHLTPFNLDETFQYIIYRQRRAGRSSSAFSDDAVVKIFENTEGIPRKINNLCDLSLLIGFGSKEEVVTSRIVENVIRDGSFF